MRLYRSMPLLAAALLVGTASAALAQVQAQYQRPGQIESAPLAPPGTIPAPRQAAPSVAPAPRPVTPGGVQRGPAPALPPGAQPAPAPGAATAPAPGSDEGGDVVVVQPPAQKIANAYAVFAGLDKITGRITSFDVAIGETAQFGALQVTPRVCYTRPATETQNTTSFTEVNEVTLQGQAKRIFTGWMFASSPGLHAVEHPIYDVWLIGCKASAPVTARGQQ
ncbi:DUF2155 domain-containing protein [Xanthobacter autotrophicus]|uniref:DUF2155 domain-containing protein n=1 Tax=Xanthobacter TaxID=279 RepID=UPI0024AC6F75|nr:DUF2155 domain-containing protein [Xanthobacter autotrophicus]MDI4666707.1 DUF2155 domain-containing protein [Xanthobacter autotrophicus]